MVHPNEIRAERMRERLKPYIGKIVSVQLHLGHALGYYHPMLYVGETNGSDWAGFVNAREVSLDGNIVFRGIYHPLDYIDERGGKERFTLCSSVNRYDEDCFGAGNCFPPIPIKDIRKVEELWEKRELPVSASV